MSKDIYENHKIVAENYYSTLLIELDYVYSEGKTVEFELLRSPN